MRRIARIGRDEGDDGGLINLTPLLDVLFVILILFILVAPMLDIDQLELAPGKGEENMKTEIKRSHPVKIFVQADNSIDLNGARVTEKELAIQLTRLFERSPHDIPQLFQDKRATFGTYQSVKNLVENSGFERLDVILEGN